MKLFACLQSNFQIMYIFNQIKKIYVKFRYYFL